jgi:diguanylate cyclase (GGDEF)-like protein
MRASIPQEARMSQLITGSRAAVLIIVLLAFLSSLLLAAEFDLVSVSEPVSGAGKRQGVELKELLSISGVFSVLLAALAWLNGKASVTDRRARRALEHTAYLDPLTGLCNRRPFNDRLVAALARSRREALPCAVLLIDLDRFKQVNDTLGHGAGDRLLIAISDRIRAFAAVPEDAARLGGDEFALILRGSAAVEEQARATIRRLQGSIAQSIVIDGRPVHPSASVGIAFVSDRTSRASDLLEAADMDMYRDKAVRHQRAAA